MSVDVQSLYKRYSSIESELTFLQRQRQQEAKKAIEALNQLSDEDVEIIATHLPMIREIKGYNEVDILENPAVVGRLQMFYSELTEYVDKLLKHYEDALC